MSRSPADERVTRPIRRCPECDYTEVARRVPARRPRRRFLEVRTPIEWAFEWTADSCPYDGNTLVGTCEEPACACLLVDAADLYCRECGIRHWWTSEVGETKELGTIGHLNVFAVRQSLATMRVDALVSTDDTFGAMRSRSAAALKRRGGEDIERESMSRRRRMGEAWRTTAGSLHAKTVIHVCTLRADDHVEESDISTAISKALVVAEEAAAESMAFPALGTGIGRLSMSTSASLARSALLEHCKGPARSLRDVFFALYRPEELAAFATAFESAATAPELATDPATDPHGAATTPSGA